MSRENRGIRICFDSTVLGKMEKLGWPPSQITNYQRAANPMALQPTDEESEIVVMEHQSRNQFTNTNWMSSLIFAVLLTIPMLAQPADKDAEEARVKASGDVIKELLNGPSGIPLSVLNKAECVIVLPSVKKVGFIV